MMTCSGAYSCPLSALPARILRLNHFMPPLDRYTVQTLTNADVARLKELLRVFAEAFGEMETYQRSVPSDDYLAQVLAKQHFIVMIAVKGEQVVGGLAAYELDKFEPSPYWRVTAARALLPN
jgi:hypothetical protein